MSIGEFEEVGTTVKDLASDNATVVVGTVLDPDLADELRVTVVATGLGAQAREERQMKLVVPKTLSAAVDYGQLERPTVMRQAANGAPEGSLEYLDIPAFLRRQAD
jgi:cell division protein FtsZ